MLKRPEPAEYAVACAQTARMACETSPPLEGRPLMPAEARFAEVLEAADRLALAEQQELVDILRLRIADQRREELRAEIREAEAEYRAGKAQPRSAQELMDEILA